MRLMTAMALINQGAPRIQTEASGRSIILAVPTCATALLLIAGLWTPIAGVLVLTVELWAVFSEPADHWTHLLVGTLGAGLALLGPGAWSVDARLFGWKRIASRPRKS